MKTECPHCNQHYEIGEEYNGQIVECQRCKQEFVAEPLPVPVVTEPLRTSKRKNKQAEKVSEAKPEITPANKKCPFCKGDIAEGAQKCCHCGEWIARPKKKLSALRIVMLVFGGIFIYLGILAVVTGFKSYDGLTQFDRSYVPAVIIFLCGGLFITVAPFCKFK